MYERQGKFHWSCFATTGCDGPYGFCSLIAPASTRSRFAPSILTLPRKLGGVLESAMKVTELNYKPGQNLACTVEKLPLSEGASDTIARLMRLDPANKKALRTAQRMRKQREVIYNRGNRDWHKREKTAKVVHVAVGENWNMTFNYDLARDIASVKQYLSIAAK